MILVSVVCRPAGHKTINAPLILKVRGIIFFAPDKKIISRTFKIRGALVFLCPKEGEERRETSDERRDMRDERRDTRDERRGDYISKLPGPK